LKKIKGFKAFGKDMTCRGFKYEFGKKYKTKNAKACEEGFHLCQYPLDLLSYYPPASRFAEVEGSGKFDKNKEDSKVACTEITIGAEITLPAIITASVDFILKHLKKGKGKKATNTGYQSAATNTGNHSAATNTGDYSAATNTGGCSAATNTGNRSAATNTGYRSAATNTGDCSAATNTGNHSAATNTGDYSAATNTGNHSAATNTGYQSAATNTGNHSAATNTGYQSAATNTGNHSAATNTGNHSAATNTGYRSAATVEGKQSIACGLGIESKAKGKKGCWLTLAEWKQDKSLEWQIKDVKSVKVDGKKIKEDVFYMLKNKKFVEID